MTNDEVRSRPDLRGKSPSQSHDFDFDSDFFQYFFDFFFVSPNCPKVCLKCKILTKWPFGTRRKRQNVFSRSLSKKFKVIFLTFFQISNKVQVMTWLDFALKKRPSAQVWSRHVMDNEERLGMIMGQSHNYKNKALKMFRKPDLNSTRIPAIKAKIKSVLWNCYFRYIF